MESQSGCATDSQLFRPSDRDDGVADMTRAIELWPELVAGRWNLLEPFTVAGVRYIIAYRNQEEASTLHALRPREQVILEFALAGHSGNWIALELNLSESNVTRVLGKALSQIGVADIAALAGLQTALFEPLDSPPDAGIHLAMTRLAAAAISVSCLSRAERAIVAGILGGKHRAAIARERGTSLRTVAHQIASIYKKLRVSSRRELF